MESYKKSMASALGLSQATPKFPRHLLASIPENGSKDINIELHGFRLAPIWDYKDDRRTNEFCADLNNQLLSGEDIQADQLTDKVLLSRLRERAVLSEIDNPSKWEFQPQPFAGLEAGQKYTLTVKLSKYQDTPFAEPAGVKPLQ